MKQLKFLHLVVGLIALIALIADQSITKQLLGYTPIVPPSASLLLAGTLLNICIGCLLAKADRNSIALQYTASLAIVGATALSGWSLLITPAATIEFGQAALGLLLIGTAAQLFASVRLPKTVSVKSSYCRELGTVKWFNITKGFGFITRDSGDDVFVHYRAIRGEGHRVLSEGQRVEFVVIDRDKGLQAEDVATLSD